LLIGVCFNYSANIIKIFDMGKFFNQKNKKGSRNGALKYEDTKIGSLFVGLNRFD
jgi:hypothetical protein